MPKPRITLKEAAPLVGKPPVPTIMEGSDTECAAEPARAAAPEMNVEGRILKFDTTKLGGKDYTFDLM
eukprot:1150413-Amphidinium_carterae.1